MCGEKASDTHTDCKASGSPPRMRGKASCILVSSSTVGITPACAGKSSERLQYRTSRRDHPRVCGEKILSEHVGGVTEGSPPRMRGKERAVKDMRAAGRITPAYAGKRCVDMSKSGTNGDHPRVCGEKSLLCLPQDWAGGSPPRMRGKDAENCPRTQGTRITPAYAGKSS